MSRDGRREVGDRKAHVVAARLVKAEDVAVAVGAVVEGCDEVLERASRVVRELGEEDLGLFFRERAHGEDLGLGVVYTYAVGMSTQFEDARICGCGGREIDRFLACVPIK